ncbi:hypothetical protein M8A51_23375 [Schlegelella sp. S2-27]|uniref:Uncharacterized protein n=1 Tax=Caldimonas mangrovi TaxID=2944811 RepID=A0ABT0YUQ5_9BURK|nr:hypothetical protein [Caldimonas mangrovi]MCM5682481.1 hypothetical protein [Caldimonas mangrovi]
MIKWTSLVVAVVAAAGLQFAAAQTSGSALTPVSGGSDVSNFTCNSKTGACKCEGRQDCFDLGNSGLCKEGSTKDGNLPDTLVCEFKFKRPARSPLIQ